MENLSTLSEKAKSLLHTFIQKSLFYVNWYEEMEEICQEVPEPPYIVQLGISKTLNAINDSDENWKSSNSYILEKYRKMNNPLFQSILAAYLELAILIDPARHPVLVTNLDRAFHCIDDLHSIGEMSDDFYFAVARTMFESEGL